MSWFLDGVERVCTGTLVRFGEDPHDVVSVHQTPRVVREIMQSTKDDMIELSHHGDTDVPIYIDPLSIVALTPTWEKVTT